MEKVLVTGGAGFIGGFVSQRLLDRGFEVHILDNLNRGRRDRFLNELLERPGCTFLQRDLSVPDAFTDLPNDYTHVLHFAAVLGVQNVLKAPYRTLRDNVLLLERMLAFAAEQARLSRFLFPSTSEVYAGSLEHMEMPVPTPESTPLALPDLAQPRTSYMLSKICGETMVIHSSLPYTIVRPHNFYGPRMGLSHVVPQLLEKAYRAPAGGEIEVFSVNHKRTFCYIDDATEMLVRAMLTPHCAGVTLNAGSQNPEITIETLAKIVIATVGKPLRIVAKPATPGSPSRRCPDMTRMTQLTGFTAGVSVDEGVRRTYEWYRRMVFEGGESEVAV